MARTKDFDENEVLRKAINLFWLKGYKGTSMQDLVDGLGISRSSLYDTYTDKHTLFIKALESYQLVGAARIGEIIKHSSSAKNTIKELMELATGDLLGDQEHKGCFMVNAEVEVAPHDRQVNSIICNNDQQMEDAFYHVIEKGKQSGQIKNPEDARALAQFISNAIKGMRVTGKSATEKSFFDGIIKLTIAALH